MLIRCLTNGDHYCGAIHTWIPDPDTYADILHHGRRHPTVETALATPWQPGHLPTPVDIPIETLLGPQGHRHCHGRILGEPDLRRAQRRRDAWLSRRDLGLPHDRGEPAAVPVTSFEDGTIVFRFGLSPDGADYDLINMYPMPLLPEPENALGGPCTLIRPYWRTRTDAPFATLLRTIDAHCHPESNRGGLEVLLQRFSRPDLDKDSERLLAELDAVYQGRAVGLHPFALYTAAEYGEGSDRAFTEALTRLLMRSRP